MSLSDPSVVTAEYASERGLESRASVYRGLAGPDAVDIALQAVSVLRPSRVLEVGCGWGAFARRVARETGAEVVAIDLSPRMVELARERGVDARVGDVAALPFADGDFDVAIANWMLYHAVDIDRALAELARVVRAGGVLVATTNGCRHLEELWALVGRDKTEEPRHFMSEDGQELLERHFRAIERHDVESTMTFDMDTARGYVASSIAHKHLADRLPELTAPLVATRRNTIFVATR